MFRMVTCTPRSLVPEANVSLSSHHSLDHASASTRSGYREYDCFQGIVLGSVAKARGFAIDTTPGLVATFSASGIPTLIFRLSYMGYS